MIGPELLLLPFDHYSRYALSRRIISLLRPSGTLLCILDVGGHSSPLKHLLPDDRIVLADMAPAGSLTSVEFLFDEYVRSSGAALPFRDGAFDIVTAHDTLEHVPPDFRPAFIDELLRVTSRFVILSGPVYEEAVVQAEHRVDVFTRKALGWQQPFLHEHLELGLPASELIETPLAERGFPFTVIPAANLARWLIMHGLQHYLAALPDTDEVRRELDRTYNLLFSERDVDGYCYRRAYVISRDGADGALISTIGSQVVNDAGQTAAASGDEAWEHLLTALENHAEAMRDHLSGLHEQIFRAEQQLFEARNEARDLGAAILEREKAVLDRDARIAEQQYEIERARLDLEELRSSMSYRLGRFASSPIRGLLRRK